MAARMVRRWHPFFRMAWVLFGIYPKDAKAGAVDCGGQLCCSRICGRLVLGILVEAPQELLHS